MRDRPCLESFLDSTGSAKGEDKDGDAIIHPTDTRRNDMEIERRLGRYLTRTALHLARAFKAAQLALQDFELLRIGLNVKEIPCQEIIARYPWQLALSGHSLRVVPGLIWRDSRWAVLRLDSPEDYCIST
jgi:hypothetical protein